MKTGYKGTFVISWHQTAVDGQPAASVNTLRTGSIWRWSGKATRVDGPADVLSLGTALGSADLHHRASRAARRLTGNIDALVKTRADADSSDWEEWLLETGFVVTDGARTYTITAIDQDDGSAPLLVTLDDLPPTDTNLWVVRAKMAKRRTTRPPLTANGVICFTPGTRLLTASGPKMVEQLREGDLVQTRDSGEQEIRWIGMRRMTGASLHAMPDLCPIRIRAGAIGDEEPDGDLLVSPDHRVLVRGAQAQALFNTPEVLVAAKDLVNDHSITTAFGMREVTYIHIALDQHQVVWANGVETESFHPAGAELNVLADEQRSRLLEIFPEVEEDPHSYGDFARRNLSAPEAAILCHEGAIRH